MLLFCDASLLLWDNISVKEKAQERANIHEPENLQSLPWIIYQLSKGYYFKLEYVMLEEENILEVYNIWLLEKSYNLAFAHKKPYEKLFI